MSAARQGSPTRTRAPDAPRPRRGWCVYLLRCADGSLYAGATNDLPKRLATHASGKGARYTRSRLPVELAWTTRAPDRSTALRREAALKRLSRAEKLALVRGGRRGSRTRRPRRARGGRGGARGATPEGAASRPAPRPS